MKSYVYMLDLKPDDRLIQEYKDHHQHVWPEVPAKLKEFGIISSKIYLLGTRLVNIMTVEDSFDPHNDFLRYTEDPKCKEWDDLMRNYQLKSPGAKDGEWWALMEEVC